MNTFKKILLFAFSSTLFLSGCGGAMVDVLPGNQVGGMHAEDENERLNDLDYPDLIAEKVAVFPIYNSTGTPDDIVKQLDFFFRREIRNSGIIKQPVFDEDMQDIFKKDGLLQQKKMVYFDTLHSVSVSDKELSNPLGKKLGVDQFLVFQISFWPCSDCLTKDIIRMKSRIIDAKTGNIIWTSIHEKYGLTPEAKENRGIGMEVAKIITDAFHHRFKEKWHKKRYRNLTNL